MPGDRSTLGRIPGAGLCVFALISFIFPAFCAHGLEAGAAKVELTPDLGTPLDGYLDRQGRGAREVHDPLYVRALYLEGEGLSVFLVSADLFSISPDLRERVLELVPPVTPPDNVIMAATHTFSGPGGLDRSWLARQRSGRFIPEWLETAAQRFAEAMKTAYESRTRCAIGYATTQQRSLSVNRFAPDGAIDPQIGVIRVDDSDGNPIAILANFGAAAQTIPDAARLTFSADFPGAFCNALEGMASEGTVAFFLNAGAADQVCANDEGTGAWSRTKAVGETLASRVKSLANDISCRESKLRFAADRRPLPPTTADNFLGGDALLQVLEIDRCAVAFVPGVPDAAITMALRNAAQRDGYLRHLTVAAANGYLGGLRSRESYAFRDPFGDPVYVGPDAESWLLDGFNALLSRSTPDEGARKEAEPTSPIVEDGFLRVAVKGTNDTQGRARGAAWATTYGQDAPSTHVSSRWIRQHPGAEPLAHWRLLGGAVAIDRLAIPLVGDATRPLLSAIPQGMFDTLAAMADQSGRPFLDVWLEQLAPGEDAQGVVSGPTGVVFGMAGKDGAFLVGHSLEWPESVMPVVARVEPKGGIPYISVGFPWQAGTVAGLNARGVVAAVSPPADRARADADAVPAELLLGELLAHARSLREAVDWLSQPRPSVRGGVVIGSANEDDPRFAVVMVGENPEISTGDGNRVVVVPDTVDPAVLVKHARVQTLLNSLHQATVHDFKQILTDEDRRVDASVRVLNPRTRACTVIDPASGAVHVMATGDGEARIFRTVTLSGDDS